MQQLIIELHQKMTEYALKSGIGKKGWSRLIEKIETRKPERQEYILTFLKKLHDNEWSAIENARNQMCATPDMWENMELFFEHEAFPEQVVVQKAMREMKARWVAFKEDYKQYREQEKADDIKRRINESLN